MSLFQHSESVNLIKLFFSTILVFITACGGGSSSKVNPPAVPTNLVASAGDGQITLSWNPVPDTTSFNLYWSTESGVDRTNGNKISDVSSPFTHSGLVIFTQYYHVVTAVNDSGESLESIEVATTTIDGSGTLDPLFSDQWHLQNTGQEGGTPGQDTNVSPVWSMGFKGEAIRIAIVDEDLEIEHEDLKNNIASGLSHNYLDGLTDPKCPENSITCGHGTAVAGLLAARDLNDLGVSGMAPRANIVGYNMLQSRNISNEADAMIRNVVDIHISNNSWGAPDNSDLHASPVLWRDAITTGLSTGRSGLGTIYVWAGGNGALAGDNSNYDGYANHRGINAICAVDDKGKRSEYSEPGANLLICAPSRDMANSGHGISTIDRTGAAGFNINGSGGNYANFNYSRNFTGTSAATPIVAGAIALVLQANPALGWRDVQLILAQTARKNDPTHLDWIQNGAGRWINHDYGFGVIDTAAAVTAAQSWSNVESVNTFTQASTPQLLIPDNTADGVTDSMTIIGSGIAEIEFIEIVFNATDHSFSGDLEITLINETTGTTSILSTKHNCPGLTCTAYNSWVFGSLRHLGEAVNGQWTLSVADLAAVDEGTFQSWSLKFYGR